MAADKVTIFVYMFLAQIPYLKSLCDIGALTNVIEYALISDEFIESCKVEQVSVKHEIDEESLENLQKSTTG